VPAIRIDAFTFEYDQLEDRICLSGNLYNSQEEISFWLTRRLVMRLLVAAVELVQKTSPTISNAPFEHKSAMAQFEHQSAQLDEANVVKKSPPAGAAVVPQINPQILHRLDISCKGERYKMSFFVIEEEKSVAVSAIDIGQFHQVLSLIHKGAVELEWGVEPNLFVDESSNTQYTLQ